MAFGAFATINKLFNNETVKLSEVEGKASEICGKTFEEIKRDYPSSDPYLYQYCTSLVYASELLVNGFGIEKNKELVRFVV